MTNYRLVIGSPTGKYVPLTQAQDGLKRLQEKNPDLVKSYEGIVLEEIRSLRQQVLMFLNRPPSNRPPF
jgi:hypothetical protein